MLSYRHAFHAGNHADVLKHSILSLVLQYLCAKDKALAYVDTHAGAGIYELNSEWASKNQEFQKGVAKLWTLESVPTELAAYMHCIRKYNPKGALHFYPGSPMFAAHFLRSMDKAFMYEMHKSEYAILRHHMQHDPRFQCESSDGYFALQARLPPVQKRGLILIDPSYETDKDYDAVVKGLTTIHRRFAAGVIMLWYPILPSQRDRGLHQRIKDTGIKDILRVGLRIDMDMLRGMHASGVYIVNPPWILREQLQVVLAFLRDVLACSDQADYHIETIREE